MASAGLVRHAVLFQIFRYRPLGCPVTHIAKVLRFNHSIATVHLVGHVHLIGGSPAPRDIGICMVAGFEGIVSHGRRPDVGETVRFLPEHCMIRRCTRRWWCTWRGTG
jgi:uncharacterized Fe-S cluster-containing protein